jgi:hypothetical protein
MSSQGEHHHAQKPSPPVDGSGGLAPGQPADLVICDGDSFQPAPGRCRPGSPDSQSGQPHRSQAARPDRPAEPHAQRHTSPMGDWLDGSRPSPSTTSTRRRRGRPTNKTERNRSTKARPDDEQPDGSAGCTCRSTRPGHRWSRRPCRATRTRRGSRSAHGTPPMSSARSMRVAPGWSRCPATTAPRGPAARSAAASAAATSPCASAANCGYPRPRQPPRRQGRRRRGKQRRRSNARRPAAPRPAA